MSEGILSTAQDALSVQISAGGTALSTPPDHATIIPFDVELEEIKLPAGSPALQGYCFGTLGDKSLLLAGRTGGVHGFSDSGDNFPRTQANRFAYVFDAALPGFIASLNLAVLGPELCDPLSATACQCLQTENWLYVVGGYGFDHKTGRMTTFDTITRIDLACLIDLLLQGVRDPARLEPLFYQSRDSRLKVTGGELCQIGSRFGLVFGQLFDGNMVESLAGYNKKGGMVQRYTERVRTFSLEPDLSIVCYEEHGPYSGLLPYNRRDLNAAAMIRSDGSQAITVYGGVFQAGTLDAHLYPIDIDPPASASAAVSVRVDTTFQQALSQYGCARLGILDVATATMYTVLFGGISQFSLRENGSDAQLVSDDLAFIDTISAIARDRNGRTEQFILPNPLPFLLGADASILPAGGIPCYPNGVLKLAGLQGRSVVGYFYGGIGAVPTTNNSQETFASDRLFRVWLNPADTPVKPMPPMPKAN